MRSLYYGEDMSLIVDSEPLESVTRDTRIFRTVHDARNYE
jgi:hypothetical protein